MIRVALFIATSTFFTYDNSFQTVAAYSPMDAQRENADVLSVVEEERSVKCYAQVLWGWVVL